MITIIAGPPLSVSFLYLWTFLDGQPNGLSLQAEMLERVPSEERQILHLIRTPEGTGLGVIRSGGEGDVWRVARHGSSLLRSGAWSCADSSVVLQGGAHTSVVFFSFQ